MQERLSSRRREARQKSREGSACNPDGGKLEGFDDGGQGSGGRGGG